MSEVRVLVGTRKGAFVLTSDGKRQRWEVSGPALWRLGNLPRQGVARGPKRVYASQSSGWFGQQIQRSNDGGKTWEPGRQQIRLRRRAWHTPVVRRQASSVGVQARLASRAIADRSGYRLRRGGGRGLVPHNGRRAELAGAFRTARPWDGASMAAGRWRDVSAYDPSRSERFRTDFHRHLGRRSVPDRRRRQDVASDQPWVEV